MHQTAPPGSFSTIRRCDEELIETIHESINTQLIALTGTIAVSARIILQGNLSVDHGQL